LRIDHGTQAGNNVSTGFPNELLVVHSQIRENQ